MESELTCPMCHEIFVDPVMLQCTHHLCAAHVSNFSGRERFTCPVCNELASVPEDGFKIEAALRIVCETYRLQAPPKIAEGEEPSDDQEGSSVKVSPPPTCGFCEEKPASRRCVQCDGVLCEECEKSTHSKGYFKTHNIVDLGAASPDGKDLASRMICQEHSEKLDFYCLECRRPVCSHCLILGDHKGHQQTPIDQAYQTGKETLSAWVDKLVQRISSTEALLESFRTSEQDILRNAEAQRGLVNNEMDHLRELIETKRHQLLSKCALEEKQKRVQLQAQIDRAEVRCGESKGLVARSEVIAAEEQHPFLAVVLPLIQDIKKCMSRPVDDNQRVSTTFRTVSTDAQVRSLGDLDLTDPRVQQQRSGLVQPVLAGAAGLHATPQHPMESTHHAYSVVQQSTYHGSSAATMPYVATQPTVQSQAGQPQVQYVYRSVPNAQ